MIVASRTMSVNYKEANNHEPKKSNNKVLNINLFLNIILCYTKVLSMLTAFINGSKNTQIGN